MILLGETEAFKEEKLYPLEVNGQHLLLIHHNKTFHLIVNRCGHFEIPLSEGEIINDTIRCPAHGICFSLKTGEIVNRPWEICDPITVIPIEIRGKMLYCDLSGIVW